MRETPTPAQNKSARRQRPRHNLRPPQTPHLLTKPASALMLVGSKKGPNPSSGLEPSCFLRRVLTLRLAAYHLLDLTLGRSPGVSAGRFRGRFLACYALYLLAIYFVGDALGICHEYCVPL